MDYLIGFLLIILLPASIIFNIILIRRGISLVKQNEQLTDIIKDYLPNENKMWFQSWVNYHKPNEVLDWHNHLWHTHGYMSLDPKETDTIFKNYTINIKL